MSTTAPRTALRLRRAPAPPPAEPSRAIVARTRARQIDLARTRLRQPRAHLSLDVHAVWRIVQPSHRAYESAATVTVHPRIARALRAELREVPPGPADARRFVLADPDLFDTPRL